MAHTRNPPITADEIDSLIAKVEAAAGVAVANLNSIISTYSAVEVLQFLKFNLIGVDPLNSREQWNFIEQVNQTFTYLASLKAAKYLFTNHPNLKSLILNLGTASGSDVRTKDNKIVAEVFASTDPQNNRKLKKDIEKVKQSGNARTRYRYVFYMSPKAASSKSILTADDAGVKVISLTETAPPLFVFEKNTRYPFQE